MLFFTLKFFVFLQNYFDKTIVYVNMVLISLKESIYHF